MKIPRSYSNTSLGAEIFPTRIKELAVCICTAAQWLGQFAIARATPSMLSSLKGGFFFFFASMMVIMGLCVFLLVPETKGRTLEAMDLIFGTAYGDLAEVDLRDYRLEVQMKGPIVREGAAREEVPNVGAAREEGLRISRDIEV